MGLLIGEQLGFRGERDVVPITEEAFQFASVKRIGGQNRFEQRSAADGVMAIEFGPRSVVGQRRRHGRLAITAQQNHQ
jgi:hypothetical protein